jgi:DNA-binding MarR family transcriptional regulator
MIPPGWDVGSNWPILVNFEFFPDFFRHFSRGSSGESRKLPESLIGPRLPPGIDRSGARMKENFYFELHPLIERLHHRLLEIVKLELDSLDAQDINSVQAVMLFSIGNSEMTIGEITLRGCYLGSNVSYNVKKMVENGYLVHERSVHDRRSIRVRATEKGRALSQKISKMHQRHLEQLQETDITETDLKEIAVTFRRLERFWMRTADLASRSPEFAA